MTYWLVKVTVKSHRLLLVCFVDSFLLILQIQVGELLSKVFGLLIKHKVEYQVVTFMMVNKHASGSEHHT